ncbi:HAMP domain-containing sensor histidine kinase [Alicyclobacillus sp. ALC3]|uniref:HAMP domain-containing sensor histidine kinase n=1 Tax=Alicyclobacillus sp. ALC3 TaxID=2796143 RepID=UPI00237A067E|nr:ATP-binding protein [Alicyclobacillus sp. ALC3]WDL96075.1 HAMP domain-containing histidine kinase [Alicyclobacillus sp. ALC3]
MPRYSLRRRVMLLVTSVILAMAVLDLVAAHWSLRRSLFSYSQHSQVDEAVDWAQLFGVLYDEFGTWKAVQQHLPHEASLQIDGQQLGRLSAVIMLKSGGVIKTQPQAEIQTNWRTAPILYHGLDVGTLYLQGYPAPQIPGLQRRITLGFDKAQFLVVFIIALLAFTFVVVEIRHFLKPLERLALSATLMTAGEFNAPLPSDGDKEIQTVVQAFSVTRSQLHEAQETRQKVVADIHHELRTPLNVIANRLEAIQLGLFHWDEQTATILQEETERLKSIVDELARLNDVESNVSQPNFAWVDIHEWLPKLVGLFGAEAANRGVLLNVEVPDQPVQVWMDRNRMSQVVVNLISNALRYTSNGQRIKVTGVKRLSAVAITVEDDGIGIAPEHLPFIFERFYRVEPSRSRATGGAGLGLAIVKEVVNAHNGDVTVRSVPGKGTRFEIILPN